MKKSIKWAGIIAAAFLTVAPTFTPNNTVYAKARTHRVSKKIAARVAKNRKVVKLLNQRKVYLFFSSSSLRKHKKAFAKLDLHPVNSKYNLGRVIINRGTYDDNGKLISRYAVDKRTGNIDYIVDNVKYKNPGYGFTVKKITAKDKKSQAKIEKIAGGGDVEFSLKFKKNMHVDRDSSYKKGDVAAADTFNFDSEVLTYKGKQYFVANDVLTKVSLSDVTIVPED